MSAQDLDDLRRMDGDPGPGLVLVAPTVQALAIRAAAEIERLRALLLDARNQLVQDACSLGVQYHLYGEQHACRQLIIRVDEERGHPPRYMERVTVW